MTAHKHAELMAEYAKDALETDKPWERWEFSTTGGGCWSTPTQEITFLSGWEYRRKRVPLCQVEGKDVFAGDRLWHKGLKCYVCVNGAITDRGWLVGADGGVAAYDPDFLSWSEPPKTKTVYQWAMKGASKVWFISLVFAETEAEVRESYDSFSVFRRLDYTALEVPCDD